MRCCFCLSLASEFNRSPWDEPLVETANFLVVPSLGSLVAGWTLIIPRQHFLSVGALPGPLTEELSALRLRIGGSLSRTFGDCCVFEHGPARSSRPVGCGVDHAHLHIVPLDFDLMEAAKPFLPSDIRWSRANAESCRSAFQRHRDYLYVEQPMGRGWIATHDHIPSQAFRKAIASALGKPQEFDWRQFPQLHHIDHTISVLSKREA
jgi:ATP adenylyltransferase